MDGARANRRPALVVDLDGCLLRTDLLIETFLMLVKSRPLDALRVPWWLARGKARLKHEIARRVDVDPASLPYNAEFLAYLVGERSRGRRLILATASHETPARRVADHLGLFDAVLASDARTNLSGERKLAAVIEHCDGGEFVYAGNSQVDLRIWPDADAAIVVNAPAQLERAVRKVVPVERVFPAQPAGIKSYIVALRVHQWLKNLLLFVPMFTAHAWGSGRTWLDVTAAFLAFGLCASSTYVMNDLFDLQADRAHPEKRHRPFAAGVIPVGVGLPMAALLMAASFGVAAIVGRPFVALLALYVVVTTAYSLYLKELILVDAITLAGLYTLRILAGGAAAGVRISFWLLAFSMFLFLSLALVKRYSEFTKLPRRARMALTGRDYRRTDLPFIVAMGIASGYLSVLVIAFFVQSPEVAQRYSRSDALWFLCPVLLYWISRMWFKAGRGEMHHDPLVYTLRDRTSQWLMLSMVAIVLIAI